MEHHGPPDENINISDVIDVIRKSDPEFVESNGEGRDSEGMISGGGVVGEGGAAAVAVNNRRQASVVIVEEPASKALRFRYECEGRSAGSIPGAGSMLENKTFPTIQVVGYKGRAVVVVSCVTKDEPYRAHPHNLVGKEGCRRGVCTVEITSENMTVTFDKLGIQCVKKRDIEESLRVREEIRVDPWRCGFSHRTQPNSIDLNAVRLCFQVFLEGAEKGRFTVPLNPVNSQIIYDKKAMSDLVICKLSHCTAPVAGGQEMILLCEKVAKEDIQVRFYEEQGGQIVWERLAEFQPTNVHKQVAIHFKTPPYRVLHVDQPVNVFIQLKRPTDQTTSEPLPFTLINYPDLPRKTTNKRPRIDPSTHVLWHEEQERRAAMLQNQNQPGPSHTREAPSAYTLQPVKAEPASSEGGSSPYQYAYGGGITGADCVSPLYPPIGGQGTPSPQPHLMQPMAWRLPSPGRTPSPMDCIPGQNQTTYNIPLTDPSPFNIPHIQSPHQQQHQQLQSLHAPALTHQQQHPYVSQQAMIPQQSATGFQQLVNPGITNTVQGMEVGAGGNMLNMDSIPQQYSQQYSFDLFPNDLHSGDLGLSNDLNLSETFERDVLLSDIRTEGRGMTTEAASIGGGNNNMTDSLDRLTTNTMQNICRLNDMTRPNRDQNG